MGNDKQIITADVYIDKKELARDFVNELNLFLKEVLPKEDKIKLIDTTTEINETDKRINELIVNIEKKFENGKRTLIKDCIVDNDTNKNLNDMIKTMFIA